MDWQSPFGVMPYTEGVMLICMTVFRMPNGMQLLAVRAELQSLQGTQSHEIA